MNNMSTKTSKEKCWCGSVQFDYAGNCLSCKARASKPVSEGKELPPNPFGDFLQSQGHEVIDVTPPSNALRSEEELRKEWLEVGQMEFKMFAGYASMVADWWIAKLTSERQRAYFEGVQNGINECKPEFDLARADERKKMGELIKKFCESKSWKEDAGNEVVQLEDILDYLSKLVKPQDK